MYATLAPAHDDPTISSATSGLRCHETAEQKNHPMNRGDGGGVIGKGSRLDLGDLAVGQQGRRTPADPVGQLPGTAAYSRSRPAAVGSECHLGGTRASWRRDNHRNITPSAHTGVSSVLPVQAGLIFAARMSFPHFSVSEITNLPKSVLDPGIVVAPSSAKRVLMVVSRRHALIARFNDSTTPVGVSRGAQTPVHPLAS